MIAALFVDPTGPYSRMPGVDLWDAQRDARRYRGPYPVVAHPPCKRWGRYWGGGPSAKTKRILGDDRGCFASALFSVRTWGGVIEHPEASHAFAWFGLRRPKRGEWLQSGGGWVTEVDQGTYGHKARKRTWLYWHSPSESTCPPPINWTEAKGLRLDHGYHSKAERAAAVANGTHKPIKRLTPRENLLTPEPFARLLVSLAKMA